MPDTHNSQRQLTTITVIIYLNHPTIDLGNCQWSHSSIVQIDSTNIFLAIQTKQRFRYQPLTNYPNLTPVLVPPIITNRYKENAEITLCYEPFRIPTESSKPVYLRLSDGLIINHNNSFKLTKMGLHNF